MAQKLSPQAKANKIAYTNDWVKKNYKAITIKVYPAEKERILAMAEAKGMSVKALIMEAIDRFGKE